MTVEQEKLLLEVADGAPYIPDVKLVPMAQAKDNAFPDLSRRTLYNYLYVYCTPPFVIKQTDGTTLEKNHGIARRHCRQYAAAVVAEKLVPCPFGILLLLVLLLRSWSLWDPPACNSGYSWQ